MELSLRFDPLEGSEPYDDGLVGEDGNGVYVYLHPDLVLSEMDPDLGATIDDWLRGEKDLSTAYQHQVWGILESARARRRRASDGR